MANAILKKIGEFMKKFIMCILALTSFSGFAEMKLESSELVYKEATTSQVLNNGKTLLSGPATLNIIEVDDENGSIKQTNIDLEFNQIIKKKIGLIVANQPHQVNGPFILLGLGKGYKTLKIIGLRGHSLKDLLDKPFKGTATSIGFIYGVTNYDVRNGAGIQLFKGATVTTALGTEEVNLTISSKNAKVEISEKGQITKAKLESILDEELK